jgi:spermidine synthase
VISDLLIPWHSGAGRLYTREHFAAVRRHLVPRGLFAQWIPLYQVSRRELFIIIRTMLEVFPQVTAWRGDFLPSHPILALIGQNDGARLDPDAVVKTFRHRRGGDEISRAHVLGLTGLSYAGNLTANHALFENSPLNTDDRPLIEYLAPLTQREAAAGAGAWFTGAALASWYEELLARVPPELDPYLGRLTAAERGYFRAGATLYAGAVARQAGHVEQARVLAARFRAEVPPDLGLAFDREIEQAASARNDAVDLSMP